MILRVLLVALAALSVTAKDEEGKHLALFNVVKFKNEGCTLQSDTSMSGTCMTKTECSSEGGSADGNCASGFGVCCSFVLSSCGGTVKQNCTYVQNEGYPSKSTTLQSCKYTMNRICDDLCQIRLDFVNLELSQPNSPAGLCAPVGDTFVAVSPVGASPPSNICGTLTGQHMYIETGNTGNAGDFTITTSIATGNRSYKIKVSYILCSSESKAPANCVQYFTGESGSMSTYNHQGGQQLGNQAYQFCIRQEEGFCMFELHESSTTTPDPFLLSGTSTAVVTDCTTAPINYIQYPIFSSTSDQRCGGIFGNTAGATHHEPVRTRRVTPFELLYVSPGDLNAATTGFNLDYNQIPC